MIVLGIDGMDPEFVERHWADLPNLARLRDGGSFSRLATTTPPQSPVAWSTFTTGLEPSGHGIFDFVYRDPVTLEPRLSMGETRPPRFTIPLGPYELPLSSPHVVSLRKGKAFWELLGRIPATVIHMPANYPPAESGKALSGMGTPDLRGTQGTFAYYTDDLEIAPGPVPGGRIVRAEIVDGHTELNIEGPPNSLRRDRQFASIKLAVDVDPDQPFARIGKTAIAGEGEWSEWIPAEFPLLPHLATVHGMFRVFARQLHPRFELYVSPIHIDPLAPDLPISVPESFSREIALRTGRYATLGIPEDTAALRQGVFNLQEFLGQSRLIIDGEKKLLDDSLNQFREGLLFCYFSFIDQTSHVLWGRHEAELLEFYRAADASIGEVRRRKPDAELMVMSDHGFTSFDRAVGLNTWLKQQGLVTKIRAMGLNALYVDRGPDHDALVKSVREKLLAWRDPKNGAAVVKTVSDTNASAPDLIVGYARGYRASWETGAGGFSAALEDNIDPWIADHCINAADVPGVLFSSRKLRVPDPSLKDLPVSILSRFGLPAGRGMSGRPVY